MSEQELLDYIIDKFNLTMDLSGTQIESFVTQLFKKIIAWEIFESTISIIFLVLAFTAFTLYIRKHNKKNNTIKYIKENWNKEGYVSREEGDKFVRYTLLYVAYIIFLVISFFTLIHNIVTLVQCLAFPEKIVLEFIGKYI